MKTTMDGGLEKALWSVAIPGFGQLLNRHYLKGTLLILMEFVINVKARINLAITYSFLGQTELAASICDYQWLLFYPCMYLFSIWDAYKFGSKKEESPLLYLPFAISAFAETTGAIYSKVFRIKGILLGPIFLPMICIFLGFGLGLIIRSIALKVILDKRN